MLQSIPVKITMCFGLNIIIKLKFTTNFDRCAILSVLNYLNKNFEPCSASSLLQISTLQHSKKASFLTETSEFSSIYDLLHIANTFNRLFALNSVA